MKCKKALITSDLLSTEHDNYSKSKKRGVKQKIQIMEKNQNLVIIAVITKDMALKNQVR